MFMDQKLWSLVVARSTWRRRWWLWLKKRTDAARCNNDAWESAHDHVDAELDVLADECKKWGPSVPAEDTIDRFRLGLTLNLTFADADASASVPKTI
jgi:hypothetical protein